MAVSPQNTIPNVISSGQLIDAGPVEADFEAVRDAYNAHTHSEYVTPSSAPGAEFDYVEFTAPVTLAATTEGTATTIVTATSLVYDGSTAYLLEFFAPYLKHLLSAGTDYSTTLILHDGTASIGKIAISPTAGANSGGGDLGGPCIARRRFVPTAGTRAYSIRGYCATASGASVGAGTGGSGNIMPGYVRIVRA